MTQGGPLMHKQPEEMVLKDDAEVMQQSTF
jgi:hypothetical protein